MAMATQQNKITCHCGSNKLSNKDVNPFQEEAEEAGEEDAEEEEDDEEEEDEEDGNCGT